MRVCCRAQSRPCRTCVSLNAALLRYWLIVALSIANVDNRHKRQNLLRTNFISQSRRVPTASPSTAPPCPLTTTLSQALNGAKDALRTARASPNLARCSSLNARPSTTTTKLIQLAKLIPILIASTVWSATSRSGLTLKRQRGFTKALNTTIILTLNI